MIKRLVLLCFISMVTFFCPAQYAALIRPAISGIQQNIVTDLSYTLIGNSKVHLQWKTSNVKAIDFFSIERSSNGKDFEVMEILKYVSGNRFELIDESPVAGRSFYRIHVSVEGKSFYSSSLSVYMGKELTYKFYPNPVDNILIVRCDMPLDIQITDASGLVHINLARVQGLQTFNISSLEKGIYMIHFTNKVSNTVNTEKLFKN